MKDKLILQMDTTATRSTEMPVTFKLFAEGEARVTWRWPEEMFATELGRDAAIKLSGEQWHFGAQSLASSWKDAAKCVTTGVLHAPLAEGAAEASTADSARALRRMSLALRIGLLRSNRGDPDLFLMMVGYEASKLNAGDIIPIAMTSLGWHSSPPGRIRAPVSGTYPQAAQPKIMRWHV